MALPTPEPGMVIHYDYLWFREAGEGRENARYARPCVIVIVSRRMTPDGLAVMVAPVTHSKPVDLDEAVEMPASVKRHLGLDDQPSWIATGEINTFLWPGHDLSRNRQSELVYGSVPRPLFSRIKQSMLAHVTSGRLKRVLR